MSIILHLSASDISRDSRILKAINVGENCNFIVNYVGLADRSAENFVSSSDHNNKVFRTDFLNF